MRRLRKRIDGGVAMDRSIGKRAGSGWMAVDRPAMRPRTSARRRPQCEAMEARRLLSASSAPSAAFLLPGSAEVARAQSIISGRAGPALQNYDSELQRLEKASRVTPAQFAALDSDAEQLAQAIDTSNLTSAAVTEQLDELQDTVDQSFLAAGDKGANWSQIQTQLDAALYGTTITTNLPGQTYAQIQLIAREAHVTLAEHKALVADAQAVTTALGPQVDTNLGGTAPRDPLVVYYNGQVNQFVHKR
jgi:hypothetical protein